MFYDSQLPIHELNALIPENTPKNEFDALISVR